MTPEEIKNNLSEIDKILSTYEDWMHGKDGDDCSKARKLLTEVTKALQQPSYTPFQTCPICQGAGKTLNIGATTAIFSPCTVCSGNKIIPMSSVKYQKTTSEAYRGGELNLEDYGL